MLQIRSSSVATAAAVFTAALLASSVALPERGDSAEARSPATSDRSSSKEGRWVGFVVATYHRFYRFPGEATEANDGRVSITVRGDGKQTASATRSVRNHYPHPECPGLYEANGVYSGPPDQSVNVTLFDGTYRVSYPNQWVPVTIHRESGCTRDPPTTTSQLALDYYVVIDGRTRRKATRVNGGFTQNMASCAPEIYCEETAAASWDLHWVPADEGGGGDGGGPGGADGTGSGGGSGGGGHGGGGNPGDGCEGRVKAGTPLDDQLIGTNRAELLLALEGADLVTAAGGNDCAWGGAGDDVLVGGPGNDLVVGDQGVDELNASRGNDELRARDGEIDTVACGPGKDRAIVDRSDAVSGCETVRAS